MTDTTPADELRTAAQTLRALATAASTDKHGNPTARWAVRQPGVTPGAPEQRDQNCALIATDEGERPNRGFRRLLRGGSGGTRGTEPSIAPQHGRYIAAMDPTVGVALADWLDSAAEDAEQIGPDPHALAVARAINGGQP